MRRNGLAGFRKLWIERFEISGYLLIGENYIDDGANNLLEVIDLVREFDEIHLGSHLGEFGEMTARETSLCSVGFLDQIGFKVQLGGLGKEFGQTAFVHFSWLVGVFASGFDRLKLGLEWKARMRLKSDINRKVNHSWIRCILFCFSICGSHYSVLAEILEYLVPRMLTLDLRCVYVMWLLSWPCALATLRLQPTTSTPRICNCNVSIVSNLETDRVYE